MTRVRLIRLAAAGWILAGTASPAGARAATAGDGGTALRSGDHPGFGRIAIDTNSQARYQLDHDGDRVVMRFSTPLRLGAPPRPPRNVVDIRTDGATAELTLLHGAAVRPSRIAGRVVLDVFDPADTPRPEPPPTAPKKAPPEPPPRPKSVLSASPELGGRAPEPAPRPPVPAAAEATPANPDPAPVESRPPPPPADPGVTDTARQAPPGRDVLPGNEGPVGLAARRIRLPRAAEGSAFLVPFAASTGAAAFREGNDTYIVFDERRPVDMAGLRDDPVFRSVSVQMLPAGTLFRVPLPPGQSVAIGQLPQGWRIAALPAAPVPRPIASLEAAGQLQLLAEQPSEVVSLADPLTGATLLAGTQHRSGQGVAIARRAAEFILRPTIMGVIAEPLGDSISMRPAKNGFSLASDTGPLAVSPSTGATAALIDAAHLTRRLDFSTMRTDALVRRIQKQLADAAAAKPQARGPKHHLVAESMMALGLEAEAGSLLQAAAEQDPKEAASPDTAALAAIANLLAGRIREASALDDPALAGTDEIALWRAVRLAMQDEGSPAAAAALAATAPLVMLYPPPIRDRILPLVTETMLQGGELGPAARLLDQRKDDPKLAYARRQEAEGDPDKALEALDALAAGHDQFDRARAGVHAAEIRLKLGKLDKGQAADALEKLIYAWRGDDRELALRERVADLRAEAGGWRPALAMLRQAETDFPEEAPAIHDRLKSMFAGMIHGGDLGKVPPLDFVAMVDENADLVPRGAEEPGIDQPLAEHLLALDLPDRAKPVLDKLLKAAAGDVSKARYGASLAMLLARERNDAGALATLDASDAPGLPADLNEQRTMIRAAALARRGDTAGATGLLGKLATGDAAAARAQVQEDANDWAAAEKAWADAAALTFPESGPLNDAQTRTLLRLATAAARAGDDAGLAAVRGTYAGRIGQGAVGDMIRLLTAEPVRTAKDIERSKQEASLAASLPAGLKALGASAPAR
jgi:hypothetical protein